MKILITGTAGFIGFHLARRLAERGDEVVGLDNINDYYDVELKYDRLAETGIERDRIAEGVLVQSSKHPHYRLIKADLKDRDALSGLFAAHKFDVVCHLAAQAGVRYSLENPHAYVDSNLVGFVNLVEGCRASGLGHLIYASSSSVYGLGQAMPFSVAGSDTDHPASLYAATKKSNELIAHCYSHLYALPCTGLRFFTVYGPWGRPDMSPFIFAKAIVEGKPLEVYNYGDMKRDFTYIDDIIEGVVRVVDKPAAVSKGAVPHRVYNIGSGFPVNLIEFIECFEKILGKKADKKLMPMQSGDVPATWADTTDLENDFGFRPTTPVQTGIDRFLEWYLSYYGGLGGDQGSGHVKL